MIRNNNLLNDNQELSVDLGIERIVSDVAMRILKLNALCGVKNQMYCTDQYVDADRVPNIRDGFFDINSLFWSKILAPQRVREILSLAMKR